MRWCSSLLPILVAASVQAAYVVNNSGRQINGTHISATEDGSVTLITASGQQLTFRKGQYRAAAADRPKELSLAQRYLSEGKMKEAIQLLTGVKADCRYLKWDQVAIKLLADAYFETGAFLEAVSEFQALEDRGPDDEARLRVAMLKSGDAERALAVLNEDIASGNRGVAAQAYLMRGEIRAAGGDRDGARRDWLKVATFFRAQKDAVAKAEDLLKE